MSTSRRRGAWFALPLAALACAAATLPSLAAGGAGAAVRPTRATGQPPVQNLRAPRNAAAGGRYVSLLFSKTEETAADNCSPDDQGIARIDTTVAPFLQSLGMTGTGTLITAKTQNTALLCVHHAESLAESWNGATRLARNFGWSFGSATATYPANLTRLTPAQQYAQTCGSAATLDQHGLPGAHGIIDYPGVQAPPTAMQATYGAQCFAWGRMYGKSGTTEAVDGRIPPYWQITRALNGGHCAQRGAPCSTIGGQTYTSPAQIISLIDSLKPGEWLTIQAYLLVTGTSPPYLSNRTRWDCTSANPALHWSNDNERYCYRDWQQIVQAVAARRDILVTDPLTVGIAFGRPSRYK